jgi:hypothetical protein
MSPAVNVTLEEVPFAILEAVKARILANRQRRNENRQRPSLRPRPQFRNVGASNKEWRPPQPVGGVFSLPRMVAGFMLRRFPATGGDIDYVEISDFEGNTTFRVDVKEVDDPFPALPPATTTSSFSESGNTRTFYSEYNGKRYLYKHLYQEGRQNGGLGVPPLYPLFVPTGKDNCIAYFPSSYVAVACVIEEKQTITAVQTIKPIFAGDGEPLSQAEKIEWIYAYNYTLKEERIAKDNSKAFLTTKTIIKEIPAARAKTIFEPFIQDYSERANSININTVLTAARDYKTVQAGRPSLSIWTDDAPRYLETVIDLDPYGSLASSVGVNAKVVLTRSVREERVYRIRDDEGRFPPQAPFSGSQLLDAWGWETLPRPNGGGFPGSVQEQVRVYLESSTISEEYASRTTLVPSLPGLEQKSLASFFNPRSTLGSPSNPGSLPIVSPGVFDVIKDPNGQNWSTPKPELKQPKFSLVQNQAYSKQSPTTGLTLRRFDTSNNGVTTTRPLNVVPRTQPAPDNPAAILRSVVCWDWGDGAYCRQKCLEIGFTAEDLQPPTP